MPHQHLLDQDGVTARIACYCVVQRIESRTAISDAPSREYIAASLTVPTGKSRVTELDVAVDERHLIALADTGSSGPNADDKLRDEDFLESDPSGTAARGRGTVVGT